MRAVEMRYFRRLTSLSHQMPTRYLIRSFRRSLVPIHLAFATLYAPSALC